MIMIRYLLGIADDEGDWLYSFTAGQLDIAQAWAKDYQSRGRTVTLFKYEKGVFYEIPVA